MARTKRNAMQIEEARKKIQTSQLINRLADHVDGKNDMTRTQIRAAEILLRKSIPDLSSIDLQADVSGKFTLKLNKDPRG